MTRASLLLLLFPLLGSLATRADANESVWVRTGATGRLLYVPDAEGDRILDFSAAGYQGRGVEALPTGIPTMRTVAPVDGDDTANVQAAINAVSAMPIGPNGFRGAVQLTAGEFDIGGQLEIRNSGVVLRGVGQSESGTVLRGRSTGAPGTNQRTLIEVFGSGGPATFGFRSTLADKVVPAGATSFRVNFASQFQPGDAVFVTRNTNQDWISDIGMDSIPPRGDGRPVNQWTPTQYRIDRVVTRVEGDRVFVDAPLPTAIEQHYGGGTIQKYLWGGAIENIGIEDLRAVSDFASDTDEDHAWEFIGLGGSQSSSAVRNVWIRNIHGKHFGDSLVIAKPSSKWVTVADVVHEEPKSVITGSRRYTYDLSGQLGLVTNARADQGRHDFVNNSTAPKGPNVFHNSIATDARSDTGPHQRWATGTLFDNVTVEGDAINVRNRGNFGSGHGWAGANMTVWNSTAETFRVQNPPTAQNWLVGSTGTIVEETRFGPQPPGNYDSHGAPVTAGGVTSLYEAQMNDARDIDSFQWRGGVGDWDDDLMWAQRVVPGVYAVADRDYLIGDIDDFAFDGDGSLDDAPIDADWQTQILATSSHSVTGFDDLNFNRNVAFTVEHQLDPGERVVHGGIALALKGTGAAVDTDFLRLFDFAPENRFGLQELGWASQINDATPFVGLVDLGPHLEELQDGRFNVQLNDDVAVDWALYNATVATPIGGAENADVSIESGEARVGSSIDGVGSLAIGEGGALRISESGSVEVLDKFTQSGDGALRIAVDEANSGRLVLSGPANLGGQLEIELADGFTPAAGDSWELISTAGQIGGAFSTVVFADLPGGLDWRLLNANGAVTASVVLTGDYNADGLVDAADYTVWRDAVTSGDHPAEADGNGDGLVDQQDYFVWRDAFGASSAAFASTIPEPTAFVGGLSLLLFTAALQRRRAAAPSTPASSKTAADGSGVATAPAPRLSRQMV